MVLFIVIVAGFIGAYLIYRATPSVDGKKAAPRKPRHSAPPRLMTPLLPAPSVSSDSGFFKPLPSPFSVVVFEVNSAKNRVRIAAQKARQGARSKFKTKWAAHVNKAHRRRGRKVASPHPTRPASRTWRTGQKSTRLLPTTTRCFRASIPTCSLESVR
ncbi:hypothetical protein B0H17DRAFT_12155 [Mycena rosella]|uniref:Uncharacterized protein n=1 Tax=Mycena rosella TaxID=1033263 RepID=A0AAD7GSR1_MYCRO|nr:hypothetical protein B0H17DRAFT_12155 [Mycena rosella]